MISPMAAVRLGLGIAKSSRLCFIVVINSMFLCFFTMMHMHFSVLKIIQPGPRVTIIRQIK